MATFFSELLGWKETAKDSQGTEFRGVDQKSPSMTTGQFLVAGYFSDCSMKLLDRYSQNNDGKPYEQLEHALFREFKSLVTVILRDFFFIRRCYKWSLL